MASSCGLVSSARFAIVSLRNYGVTVGCAASVWVQQSWHGVVRAVDLQVAQLCSHEDGEDSSRLLQPLALIADCRMHCTCDYKGFKVYGCCCGCAQWHLYCGKFLCELLLP